MHTYVWVGLGALLLLNIISIIQLFRSREELTVEGLEENKGVFDYLKLNLNTPPLESIQFAPAECPAGSQPLNLFGAWPGIEQGCYCSKARVKFMEGKCLEKDVSASRCVDVDPIAWRAFSKWKGKLLCGVPANYVTVALPANECTNQNSATCCREGERQCQSDLCVPTGKECPITSLKRVSFANKTKSNRISRAYNPSTGHHNYHRLLQTIVEPMRRPPGPPKQVPFRADAETVFLDGNTAFQVGRDDSTRPLLLFGVSRSALPCFDFGTEPEGEPNSQYPLLNNSAMAPACDPYGFDTVYSARLDDISELDMLRDNAIIPTPTPVPEYEKYVTNTRLYLTSRQLIQRNLTETCTSFSVDALTEFEPKLASLRRALLIIEIIHGVVLVLGIIAVIGLYEFRDYPQVRKVFPDGRRFLIAGLIGLGVILLLTGLRMWICQKYVNELQEAEFNKANFIQANCLADYRYTDIMRGIVVNPSYLDIGDINKKFFLWSLLFILLNAVLAIVSYLQDRKVQYTKLSEERPVDIPLPFETTYPSMAPEVEKPRIPADVAVVQGSQFGASSYGFPRAGELITGQRAGDDFNPVVAADSTRVPVSQQGGVSPTRVPVPIPLGQQQPVNLMQQSGPMGMTGSMRGVPGVNTPTNTLQQSITGQQPMPVPVGMPGQPPIVASQATNLPQQSPMNFQSMGGQQGPLPQVLVGIQAPLSNPTSVPIATTTFQNQPSGPINQPTIAPRNTRT